MRESELPMFCRISNSVKISCCGSEIELLQRHRLRCAYHVGRSLLVAMLFRVVERAHFDGLQLLIELGDRLEKLLEDVRIELVLLTCSHVEGCLKIFPSVHRAAVVTRGPGGKPVAHEIEEPVRNHPRDHPVNHGHRQHQRIGNGNDVVGPRYADDPAGAHAGDESHTDQSDPFGERQTRDEIADGHEGPGECGRTQDGYRVGEDSDPDGPFVQIQLRLKSAGGTGVTPCVSRFPGSPPRPRESRILTPLSRVQATPAPPWDQ